MQENNFYPLYFKPIYKDYIWGGRNIAMDYQRIDAPNRVAESWEIADRADGMSIVANGPLLGLSLQEIMGKWGEGLLGKNRQFSSFPLLIKLIDAEENLSVQVHPDDLCAKRLGAEPKSEMWYFLKTKQNAFVYAGLKPNIDRGIFEKSLQENSILDVLEEVPVATGDVASIPGGTLHAILSGCQLLEVQQNSNTTYRVHDWGRVDVNGQRRALHLEESLQSINWDHRSQTKIAPQFLYQDPKLQIQLLLKTPHFTLQKIETREQWIAQNNTDSFQILFSLDGNALLTADGWQEKMIMGRAYLVPAGCKKVNIGSTLDTTKLLRITL